MRSIFAGKLIFFITLPIIILAVVALFDIRDSLKSSGMNQLKAHMLELVQHYAAEVSSELDKAVTIADTTALNLSANPIQDITSHYAYLRNNLMQNKVIFGSVIAYEKVYSPTNELFAPYVYRDKEKLKQMDVAKDAYDYTESKWDWFHGPKNHMEGFWSEPYFDENAGNVLMVTYSSPILQKDIFTGVVTIDIDLLSLHNTLNISGLDKSNYVILTNTGHFAYHSKKDLIGKSFLNLADDKKLEKSIYIARKMITGQKGYIDIVNKKKEEDMIFFAPIGKYGWSFALSLSKKSAESIVFKNQNVTSLWLLAILIVGLVLSLLVSYYSLQKPLSIMIKGIYEITSNSTKTLVSYSFPAPFDKLSETIVKVFSAKNKQIEKAKEELKLSERALKKTTSILKESDRRVKGLLSTSTNSVIIINQFYEIVAANIKSEQTLRLKSKNLIGTSILNYVDAQDKEMIRNTLDDLFSTYSTKTINDLHIVNKLGNKQKVKVDMTPVFVSQDEIEANIILTRYDDES